MVYLCDKEVLSGSGGTPTLQCSVNLGININCGLMHVCCCDLDVHKRTRLCLFLTPLHLSRPCERHAMPRCHDVKLPGSTDYAGEGQEAPNYGFIMHNLGILSA
jgi:hypothetical protein